MTGSLVFAAAALITFVILYKSAQRTQPVAIDPALVVPGNEIEAVEFFWRPG